MNCHKTSLDSVMSSAADVRSWQQSRLRHFGSGPLARLESNTYHIEIHFSSVPFLRHMHPEVRFSYCMMLLVNAHVYQIARDNSDTFFYSALAWAPKGDSVLVAHSWMNLESSYSNRLASRALWIQAS